MRILISSMSIQNFQNFIRSEFFARYLADKGHEVTVLTAAPRNKWYKFAIYRTGNAKIIVIPDIVNWRLRRGGLGPINILFRFIYVLTHRFDIYHGDGHRPAILWPLLLARKLFKKPYLSEWMDIFGKGGIVDKRNTLERWLIGPYDKYFESKTRQWADGSIVLSMSLYERVRQLGVPDHRILLLHGGADVDDIRVISKAEARKRLDLPQDRFIMGLVGINKDDLPDLEILFQAIEKLDPKIRSRILCSGTGNLDSFNEIVEKRGQANKWQYLGWIDDYNAFLCACDVHLMPMHDNERNRNKWPNRLGDFLAGGRAVITNPVGDVVPYFENNDIGYMIDGTPEALSATIARCLTEPERIAEMGENARNLSETAISWQMHTEKLVRFYQDISGNSQQEPADEKEPVIQ